MPSLLAVIELGGYPDYSAVYRRAGFDATTATSTRKALAQIKRHPPRVVVAEFIYSPTYGTRISNLEALAAGMQRDAPGARLLILIDSEYLHHLKSIHHCLPCHEVVTFPLNDTSLLQGIERLTEGTAQD